MSFADLLAAAEPLEDGFRVAIPEDWLQGRTAYGGLTPAPATKDGWWLLRSTGDYAEKGCSSQRMAMWNADGVPVLAGMQSVALFG